MDYTMCVTSEAGTAHRSGEPVFTPFLWGLCYSILSFLWNVLWTIVCCFVLFLLV